MTSVDAWAQLVCTTDTESEPFQLKMEKITIGRGKDNDISLDDNKLVSGHHCFIQRDETGKAWLYDTSTNGTLINVKKKISKGKKIQLNHGDEIHIVFRKDDASKNVAFLYQDMQELQREELDATQEYSDGTELTYEEEEEVDKPQDGSVVEPPNKKLKSDSPQPTTCTSSENVKPSANITGKCDEDKPKEDLESDASNVDNTSKTTDSPEDSDKKQTKAADEAKDAMEETLLCTICQEILHDCISLQPCMHSFCAGCYSVWMERSNECPTCRIKVERINKNHIVNNLVEAYLKTHPERTRPEEDIKDLDAKNKITKDMLYPKKPHRATYSDEDSLSSSDSGEITLPSNVFHTLLNDFTGGHGLAFGSHVVPTVIQTRPAPRPICRSCPGYTPPATQTTTGITNTGGSVVAVGSSSAHAASNVVQPSTSDSAAGNDESVTIDNGKVMPTPPNHVCGANENHAMCACCKEPVPDRRYMQHADPTVPRIQCEICWKMFCHAYWGCRKAACRGCMAQFKDLNFDPQCLERLVLENTHESKILQDYLQSKNLTIKDMLTACMDKIDSGTYKCRDTIGLRPVRSTSYLCYTCGLQNLKELAYQYRKDIPAEQLPDSVNARENCYWGKNCRTQTHKPNHAKHFNHICEQTRMGRR